jgi:hypothetical protein
MTKTETYYMGESEIEVTFDDLQYQFLSSDNPPYDKTYECRGYDDEGRIYSGIAEFSCDELVEITDIECIKDVVFEREAAYYAPLYKAEVAAGLYDPKNPTKSLDEIHRENANFKYFGVEPNRD